MVAGGGQGRTRLLSTAFAASTPLPPSGIFGSSTIQPPPSLPCVPPAAPAPAP